MSEQFRTQITDGDDRIGVDRSSRQIRGATVIQAGRVSDSRPFVVDDTTLSQVVELGNRSNKGVRARFTHAWETMGKHLGRWTNFRIDEDRVRADLKLAESASQSPDGDYATYLLSLADEDPEAFGVSVVVGLTASAAEGQDEIPLRIDSLDAADFVGEPAATHTGLFAESLAEPAAPSEEMMAEKTTAAVEPKDDGPSEVDVFRAEVARYVEAFGDRGATWALAGKPIEECFAVAIAEKDQALAEAKDAATELQKTIVALEARLEAAKVEGTESEELPTNHPAPATAIKYAGGQKAGIPFGRSAV